MDGGSSSGTSRASNKRSYSTMATDAQRSISPAVYPPHNTMYDDHYNNDHRRQRRREEYILPPLDSARFEGGYAGRGFDYRRPAAALDTRTPPARSAETIDLTSEQPDEQDGRTTQRLPRYGRDIIDTDSNSVRQQRSSILRPVVHRTASGLSIRRQESPLFVQDDEIEFVSSRPLSRATSRNVSVVPGAGELRAEDYVDLTDDQDDEIVITDERPATTGVNAQEPILSATVGVRAPAAHSMLEGFSGFANLLSNAPGRLYDRYRQHYNQARDPQVAQYRAQRDAAMQSRTALGADLPHGFHLLADFFTGTMSEGQPHRSNLIRMPPVNLDFGTAAFSLGLDEARTPESQYEAPAPPAAGFTRNPKNDEEVVCPNCGVELAVEGDETQREVWVVRQCGHAYCGKCVRARFENSRKGNRDKQREDEPPILKKCLMDGRPVNKTTMVHAFLSS